ncbi:helix-hairpin-helix domain-containing protein [Planctomycetota bacterium]
MGEPQFSRGRRHAVDRWLRHRVLQSVPHVGPKRAAALLNHFGTLGPIFTALPEALVEVDGVGRHTAGILALLGLGADGRATDQEPRTHSESDEIRT